MTRCNRLLLAAFSGLIASPLFAQQSGSQTVLPVKNTYAISKGDTEQDILAKAIRVVPTSKQYAALQDEFIAFIHFGPNTFTKMEWGNGKEDPRIFDLKNLDTDQWCATMRDAGMKKVILTVKHHDGFVLWQSRYTDHGIMSTGFRQGKGDILKDLSQSCQKYGLKLGIYLSPADLFQIENEKGLYGNLSTYSKRTIPRRVEGRPFQNKKTFEFDVDDYNEYFLNQLFELLTEYGPVHEVWFDGAHPKTKGGQKYNYAAWRTLIHTLAPEAVIFGKEDIRWCGNEAGGTRKTEWNVIPYDADPHNLEGFRDLTEDDLGSRAQLYTAKYLHYQQAETNTSIREGWFYRDDVYQKVRSADDVFDIYERSVGGNSTFLLNIPPNRDGLFSAEDVEVLTEVGQRIKEGYSTNLLEEAIQLQLKLRSNLSTTFVLDRGHIEFVTKKPIRINRFVLQEAIQTHGERIEKHALDVWRDGKWEQVAEGTNVGYKRILRFPVIEGSKFRVRVSESRAIPVLSNIGAFYVPVRPPQLAIRKDVNGQVTIAPQRHEFGWKPHGEDAVANQQSSFTIYYTEDGTNPTSKSQQYTGAFVPQASRIKAVAVDGAGMLGPMVDETIGFAKKQWKVISNSSERAKATAAMAIDEDPDTYWHSSATGATQSIEIDLGAMCDFSAFSYTPQRKHPEGMMAKGKLFTSVDGKVWSETGSFEFGNLINDPSKRKHVFSGKVRARYVRLVSTEITGNGNSLSMSELDFYP
ncbi:alpha-1,3/4-fucosidase [Sphingobacterium psychroaquaticum]|uniref:alpha-L-fucosidase n=1 Tax=Sphingobacterium psychroaquaticum TaxID=561061 RepID=UPI00106DA381|nr:alpha-L-fucosidase [Sphingobacterium psychroaquaticum]QBQ39923.1 alpha-1,3/4-fucosidase [Sphingobacterium psychroaquaticum]